MYNEEYNRRGFLIRGFLLKLILVIIVSVLFISLLLKFIKPDIITNDFDDTFSPVTSQMFADNIDKLKDIAVAYYTEDELSRVNEFSTLTLNDMISQGLLTSLTDGNNKSYDTEKSYVQITNIGDSYVLKINLKNGKEEKYVLIHLGYYSYCHFDICEKRL